MDMKAIGIRIKQRRESLNMSAAELADRVGLNKATIHHYERGDFQTFRTTSENAIADALQVSKAWLEGTTDNMTPEADALLLSPADRKDVVHIVEACRQLLLQDGLTFGGIPADRDSVMIIYNSLSVAVETAKIQNKARYDLIDKERTVETSFDLKTEKESKLA